MKVELPSNDWWCGQEIPTCRNETIFAYLARAGVPKTPREKTRLEFWFGLTSDEVEYWIGEFRYLRRL